MLSKKMATLYLYTLYAGLVVTYFCGVVPILISDKLINQGITDKVTINRNTVNVMIFFGISDAMGGYIFGKLSNNMGKRSGMLLILIAGLFAIGITYYAQYYVIL